MPVITPVLYVMLASPIQSYFIVYAGALFCFRLHIKDLPPFHGHGISDVTPIPTVLNLDPLRRPIISQRDSSPAPLAPGEA